MKIFIEESSATSGTHSETLPFLVTFTLVWAFVMWFSSGNLDGYHDMLENFAWSQSWDWGTHKHPPLFAWVVGVWFAVFPTGDFSYRLLAYVNVAVGLWGIVSLARRLGLTSLASTAVLLLMWSFPYSTLAAKFNANSQLLSLWPWTAAWLLASWQERGARGYLFSVLLGLGAALSMLGKYYSGIFLAGFLVPAFLGSQGRRWFQTPKPYLALLVFFLALAPHIHWLASHDFVSIKYAGDQGGGETHWDAVWKFALSPIYYWLPGWLAASAVFAAVWCRQSGGPSWLTGCLRLMWRSWLPQARDDVLFWLACMPWLLSLLCGVVGLAELSTPWAIPIGYAYSLLWLRNMQQEVPDAVPAVIARLRKAFGPVLLLAIALGLVVAWGNARNGQDNYYRPSQEAAKAIADQWTKNHPQVQLGWVSGAWAENAILAFYALPAVRTLPAFPDEYPSTHSPYATWQNEGGVVICPLGKITPENPRLSGESSCEKHAVQWLQGHSRPVQIRRLEVQRHGWLFPRAHPFAYAVFDVLPQAR